MVKFKRPPLSEVSFSIEFPAQDLASVHYGLYWQSIRSDFPSCFDRPLLTSPLANTINFSNLPSLRRVWYESSDRHQLIQLQPDRFIYNWRRLDNEYEYPSFEAIFPLFLKHWEHFQSWWESEMGRAIQPVGYTLTYTNEIGQEHGWTSAEDHPAIFRFISPDSQHFPNKRLFNVTLELNLSNNVGILAINVYDAIKTATNAKVTFLELSVVSERFPDKLTTWFHKAHQSIIDNFLTLITTQAQQNWGLYE